MGEHRLRLGPHTLAAYLREAGVPTLALVVDDTAILIQPELPVIAGMPDAAARLALATEMFHAAVLTEFQRALWPRRP